LANLFELYDDAWTCQRQMLKVSQCFWSQDQEGLSPAPHACAAKCHSISHQWHYKLPRH